MIKFVREETDAKSDGVSKATRILTRKNTKQGDSFSSVMGAIEEDMVSHVKVVADIG